MQPRTPALALAGLTLALLAPACARAQERGGTQRGGQESAPTRGERATGAEAPAADFETLTHKLSDGVVMTADLYRKPKAAADTPVLVCMHMTRSSRGEYRPLAPRFVSLGFHVLSVDLRCGGEGEKMDRRTKARSGTPNATWTDAKQKLGREMTYADAYPDVGAAIAWARELFPKARIGLVGSSYSATLALVWAAEHPKDVDLVVALSPGDYLPEWSPVKERIKTLRVPAYITCGNTPADTDQAKPIAEAIEDRSHLATFWPGDEGYVGHHGTMTFFVPEERNVAKQWEMFEKAVAPLAASAKGARKDEAQPAPPPKRGAGG